MGSSGWNHHDQNQNLQPPAEDDFHQFFEMQGIGNMADGLNFDFQSYHDSSASGLLPQAQREQMDTSMGGTEPSLVVPTTSGMGREQMAAMTTGASQPSLQAHMGRMPPTPTNSISDLDAQIQYLQQQRLEQQHRQLREQHSYYGPGPNRIIPPTPRSLELQPGSGQFFSPTETPMFDSRVHLKDTQQDVSRPDPGALAAERTRN
ncbi:MAG: hypothetical protein IMZ46_01040 [Acidobacteria bacterium]|nr:hypothetical protein [Acidobacteriota bacterium]